MTEQVLSTLVLTHTENGIQRIQLNRPEKKNALTVAMYQRLTELLVEADADDTVRVIVITGSGDSFSSGNDLADFIKAGSQVINDNPAQRLLHQISEQKKPVVAAVNGLAVGIGTTLLLHCDLVYAAESAYFKLPFVELGLVPEGGSSCLLPQMLGHRRAAELLLLGDSLMPAKAQAFGIVTEVVADSELALRAQQAAETLASRLPQALQQAKAMMRQNPERPLAEVIDCEIEQFLARLQTPETQQILLGRMQRR